MRDIMTGRSARESVNYVGQDIGNEGDVQGPSPEESFHITLCYGLGLVTATFGPCKQEAFVALTSARRATTHVFLT